MKMKSFLNIVVTVGVVLIILLLFASPFVVIPSGWVGVKMTLGKVSDEELHPGLHFIVPVVQKVVKMSTRTRAYDLVGQNAIEALSKDGLTVRIELTALYRIKPERASDIFVKYGLRYEDSIIKPVIRSAVRDVIAELESAKVYTERSFIRQELEKVVSRKLEKRFIILDEILLRDIKLPPKVVEAIEQKRRAYEEAERMKFLVEKEKLEAERKRIEARGIADANRIIAGSLTKEYLMWKFIENIQEYAKSQNNTIVVFPYDSKLIPIIVGGR